ncbi:MAG: M60 family metallopeptidase, partial [Armatimonadota bacterium]|nr:M60 family metallopeptidase [Armatimonadota bacterium]
LQGQDVLIISAHDITTEQVEPIRQFVSRGGGLITVATGWGWEQLNPRHSLSADFPANQLLATWGLIVTGGTLDRTGKVGFLTDPRPSPLVSANRALDTAFLYVRGQGILAPSDMEQVETVVTHAAEAMPADDTLLMPRLRELTHSMTGDIVPFPGKPVAKTDLAARLLLTLQINTLKAMPPSEVRAHPAGAIFPGEVPMAARTTKLTIPIDTTVPDWHSLGLYAAPGALITVGLPADAANKGLGVRIGSHTDTLWDQDKWERAPDISRSFALNGIETKAANAFGGLVYITVPQNSKLGVVPVVISGAVLAPLYVRGQTTVQEWHDTIRKRPGPWAELASDKLILTVPSRVARTLDDPEALMQYWDAGMDAVADLAGIPHQRKRPERIVTDQQISAGYMHSGYPIMTWLDVANMDVDLPELMKGDWGHWHEMGHNHQVGDWTFEGTGEVTNNMFSLYVNEKVGHIPGGLAHPNVQPAWQQKAIHDYLASGAPYEKWKSDPFLALTMYIQLRDAFGWDAYKKVFAEYRTLPDSERPKTDEDKRDQWMVRFSRTVGKNLGPFFQRWGVPTSQAARDSIANLPGWMPAGMG